MSINVSPCFASWGLIVDSHKLRSGLGSVFIADATTFDCQVEQMAILVPGFASFIIVVHCLIEA